MNGPDGGFAGLNDEDAALDGTCQKRRIRKAQDWWGVDYDMIKVLEHLFDERIHPIAA